MPTKPIPDSAKLPPKSLNEDTQDDELPEANVDDQRKPPVSMGSSREAGDGVSESDPETRRVDHKGRIPAPQFQPEVIVMGESKNYLNTDEIQADDQLSPKPVEGKDPPRHVRKSEEAVAEGSDDTERIRVPPPVANPD